MPEQSRCCRCGGYFYGDDSVCPACRRNEAAEEAARKRHEEQLAAQEETQALIEEQMERARTENCLLCGTAVHTGEGSGFYHPECLFPNYGRVAIQAARAGKLSKSVSLKNSIRFNRPEPCSVDFVPDPAVWSVLKPLLDDYERDCSENSGSQDRIGPYCSQKCFDEAKATDPRFAKVDEDRARIAAKWERISSMPEWASFLESYEAARARLDAHGKQMEESMRARDRRMSEESRKKNAGKNFLVFSAIAVAAFWFLWLKPHRESRRERAEVQARLERETRLEQEKKDCSEYLRSLGRKANPASAGGVKCPAGGELEISVRGNTKAAHAWDPDLPVLYAIRCPLHETEFGTDNNLADFDEVGKYAFRLSENMESDGGKTKAGAAFHSLFSPAEIAKFASVKAVRGPDGKTLSVDPYASVATAKARLSFDETAYEAWAARLSAALEPFAVETDKTRLVASQDDGRGGSRQSPRRLVSTKRFDRGHAFYIVRDAKKLKADVLLFDDDTWKGLRAAIGFNLRGEGEFRWTVEGGVPLSDGKKAVAEAFVCGLLAENVVLPRFASHQNGGLLLESSAPTADVEFKWNGVKRDDASAKPVFRLNLLPSLSYVRKPSKIR